MFIVNSDGSNCTQINLLEFKIKQNKDVVKKIERKREEIRNSLSLFGCPVFESTIEKHVQAYIDELNEDILESVIYVNGKPYGRYSVEYGKIIFDEIILFMKQNKTVFDLRDYEKGKETD